jgi:hypothetical protein
VISNARKSPIASQATAAAISSMLANVVRGASRRLFSSASAAAGPAAVTSAVDGRSRIKAAVARGPKLPFTIEELLLDEPQAGEVLVKVVACGICHTDLVRGAWGWACGTPSHLCMAH